MSNAQTEDQLFGLVATQRRHIADQLDELTPEQWAAQSLCADWTVRQLAGHLTMGWNVSTPKFMLGMAKFRGNFDKLSVSLSNKLAERPTSEIVADIRANAEHRFTPPGEGALAPLSDSVIHGFDMLVPLGIDAPASSEALTPVLQRLANPPKRWIFPLKDTTGLRFEATDLEWSSGDGDVVSGPAADMALALSGRAHGFDALAGDGVAELRRRSNL